MPKEKPAKRRKNAIVANAARGSRQSRADARVERKLLKSFTRAQENRIGEMLDHANDDAGSTVGLLRQLFYGEKI